MDKKIGRVGFTVIFIGLIVLSSVGFATDRLVPSVYPTIQSAINDAVEGDTVIVDPSTYTGVANTNLTFQGYTITVRSINPDNPDIVAAVLFEGESGSSGCITDHTFGPFCSNFSKIKYLLRFNEMPPINRGHQEVKE